MINLQQSAATVGARGSTQGTHLAFLLAGEGTSGEIQPREQLSIQRLLLLQQLSCEAVQEGGGVAPVQFTTHPWEGAHPQCEPDSSSDQLAQLLIAI